jgi:hypothetical protein
MERLMFLAGDVDFPVFPIQPLLPGIRHLSSEDLKRDGKRIPSCPYLLCNNKEEYLSLEWCELSQQLSSLIPLAQAKLLYFVPGLPSKKEVREFHSTLKSTGDVPYFERRHIQSI